MNTAHNPVIRGFNPDPSILRVGKDYYVATSTFEWYPGVRIHHSRDLAHWQVLGHALDERNGFDMRGIPDSGGVWAPSLTYADGKYWLVYSVVRTMDGDNKDLENYLVMAHDPRGPWSEPISLGSRGFDFSFFHDEGRHWIVGVQWDQRPGRTRFGGIVLEEFLPDQQRTSGNAFLIYQQTGLVEGPNLYRFGDEYHLLLAEGGTGWNHGITSARSANLLGLYTRDPKPAVLTTRDAPGVPLQKAGHGELVELPTGELFLVHLVSRPTLHLGERYSTLGRETCLQRVRFDADGWLRLHGDGHHPAVEVDIPLGTAETPTLPERDGFDITTLDRSRWSTLRAPLDAYLDFESRPGWLRLHGAQSTSSVFDQAMIAQRVTEHHTIAETTLDAEPRTPRHAAGLIAWYDRHSWIWFQLTYSAENGRHLRVLFRDGTQTAYRCEPIPVAFTPVHLRMRLDGPDLACDWSSDGISWETAAETLPAWTLSDDHGGRLRFTGAFIGVRAEDLDGDGWHADFDHVSIAASHAADGA